MKEPREADAKSSDTERPIAPGSASGPGLVSGLGLAAAALFSLVVTFVLTAASQSTPGISPFTAGQTACLLLFAFCIALWVLVHASALLLTTRDALLAGDWQPQLWKRHVGALIGDTNYSYLNHATEFALILIIFYVCDRTTWIPRANKVYDRDAFWFIWICLTIGSLATIRKIKEPGGKAHVKPLQREQTEEWRGWMQVMFLMYHYFHATDLYNAIRVYIAAYVWMTGYGNFSYYYVKKDFSLTRFCAMMWRLNFFVFFCCATLNDQYMLYYICMLHTTFTVFIYAALGLWYQRNTVGTALRLKFVVLLAVVLFIWNVPGVFQMLWRPLYFLVQYEGDLHEWTFRSTLDHVVWIAGMLTAFNHPKVDDLLQQLDAMERRRQYLVKAGVAATALFVGYQWVVNAFLLPKRDYNALHPFTSWIPITVYIVLRNISSRLRQYHLHMWAWLGKITLETYIAQFHVWMATTGPNGNPKKLLRVLPEGYPLLNFVVVSLFLVFVSLRIFHNTNGLRALAVPNEAAKLKRNLVLGPVFVGAVYLLGVGVRGVALA